MIISENIVDSIAPWTPSFGINIKLKKTLKIKAISVTQKMTCSCPLETRKLDITPYEKTRGK